MDYPGINGFLGTRASIMLDIVFLAMFVVLVAMFWSIFQVKRGRYGLHKQIQLVLGLVLLVAITAFEVDMQFLTEWEARAAESPYFPEDYDSMSAKWGSVAGISLLIHLSFAVPTAVLWVLVISRAVKRFGHPPAPGEHSKSHIFWARLAAFGMTMTAATGWVFYWLAFVARAVSY